MQLLDPAGRDITPKSAKAQGLLAILAMQRGRPMARAALQDLLWSDRGPTHGRDSLKKSLALLKSTFGADGKDIIQTAGGPVALNMNRARVDIFEAPTDYETAVIAQDFLAGIDIRDPEFEDWLRNMRRAIGTPEATGTFSTTAHPPLRQQFHVALMPPTTAGTDDFAALFSGLIVDRIAVAMRSYDLFKVLDFREAPGRAARGADVVLDFKALSLGEDVAIQMLARALPDNEIVWGYRRTLPRTGFGASKIGALVSEVVDGMSDTFRRAKGLGNERSRAARNAMDGIDRIFRLTDKDLDSAALSLRTAIDLDPKRSTYRAWYAFLSAFRLEATKGAETAELRELADEIARNALEIDPNNPLTRSLLTHVFAFVMQDFERAHAMIDPLENIAPDLPFYHMSRALLGFYTGKTDTAKKMALPLKAYPSAGLGSYMHLTALAMIHLGNGDIEAAVKLGNKALAVQSDRSVKYEPTLRYLAAAHAKNGNAAEARKLIKTLRSQSSHYSDRLVPHEFMAPRTHMLKLFPSQEELKRILRE